MGAPAANTSPLPTGRRPSHPIPQSLIFYLYFYAVHFRGTHTIATGASYGQLNYVTSIVYNDPSAPGGQQNVLIDLYGYGTRNNGLAQDQVYQLMGRFLGLNDGSEPIVFYEHSLNLPLGPSTAFVNAQDISSLASKVAVFGFGVVVHHEEVTAVGSNSSTQTNLRVTLHHTDYHTVRRDCVEFDTVYVIPGNAILRGTFGLLQLGREALIVGYMGGYDVKKHSWEVQGLLLSMLSGPQSRGAASPGTLPGSANSRRPNLKRLSGLTANGQGDADKDVQEHNSKRTTFDPASIFPVPSTSQQNVCPDEPREEGQVSDDGEDDDDDPAGDNTFHNTYPDKPSCLSSGSVKGKEKANKPGMLTDAQQKARSNLGGKGKNK
ncbi:hypothetical protein MJO29_006130 [Puccinia striiformis f. sp. tritici]|nr:hypothetical protein MJO29_006130 [Puccinia striiformis f. sp. tritici]